MTPLARLAESYPAWWVDLLGEHNHVGGPATTRWLLERSGLQPGGRMLDCGAFVGAAARMAAEAGFRAVAADLNVDFLATGRAMAGGAGTTWVAAATQRLPFRDGSFNSVWALDTTIVPREMTRVAAPGATLCLCSEAPNDSRGGLDAFIDEWAELGWSLVAHKQVSLEALDAWRRAEAEMVARKPVFEPRYGKRGYLAQLDFLASRVKEYERGENGHGLFVFRRA